MDFKIYFYDLRKLQFNKIFLKKRNSRGNPHCGIYIKRRKNKIEKVQSPRRATAAQECPHQREKLKRKKKLCINYTEFTQSKKTCFLLSFSLCACTIAASSTN